MVQQLEHLISHFKHRYKDIAFGLVLSLTFMPSLMVYVNGQVVNYTSYGLPKVFILLFMSYVLFTFRFRYPKSSLHIALWVTFSVVSLWFNVVGFYSLSLFFGIGTLILWSASCNDKREYKKTIGFLFVLFLILVPFISNMLIQHFRHLSMIIVDELLQLVQVPFERASTLYTLSNMKIGIWERCSGYSTFRVFLIVLSFMFLVQRKYIKMLLYAPVLAVVLGISCNVLRIFIHLVFSYERGEELSSFTHELIGITIFAIVSIVAIYFLSKNFRYFPSKNRLAHEVGRLSKSKASLITLFVVTMLVPGLTLLPCRLEKKIEHDYWTKLNRNFEIEHHNYFRERAGGGTWILFEYPIRYCYKYFGWEEGADTGFMYKDTDAVKIGTKYEIGNTVIENRFEAILYKMLRLDLWDAEVKATIVITDLQSEIKY